MIREAAAQLHGADPSPAAVTALLHLFNQCMLGGDFSGAVRAADSGLSTLSRLSEPLTRLRAEVLGARGLGKTLEGDPSGVDDIREALRRAEQHNITTIMILSHMDLGTALVDSDSFTAAMPHMEAATMLAARAGKVGMHVLAAANLAGALVETGQLRRALSTCEDAETVAARVEDRRVRAVLRASEAHALWLSGRTEAAGEAATSAMEDARGTYPDVEVPIAVVAAEVAVHSSSIDAGDLIGSLVALCGKSETQAYLKYSLPRLARLLVAADRLDILAGLTAAAARAAPFEGAAWLAAEATLSEATGDHVEASRQYQDAARLWSDHGAVIEQGWALLGAVRCCQAMQLDPSPLVRAARAVLASTGASELLGQLPRTSLRTARWPVPGVP